MYKAKLVSWNQKRFFGFLQVEGEQVDYFVHGSQLPVGYMPNLGDSFECELRQTPKGVQARSIRVLSGGTGSLSSPTATIEAQGGERS